VQVQVFNRAFVPMQLVVVRAFGAKPGDFYISVQKRLGPGSPAALSFQGAPAGTTLLADGAWLCQHSRRLLSHFHGVQCICPGGPGRNQQHTFVAVAGAIYNKLERLTKRFPGH